MIRDKLFFYLYLLFPIQNKSPITEQGGLELIPSAPPNETSDVAHLLTEKRELFFFISSFLSHPLRPSLLPSPVARARFLPLSRRAEAGSAPSTGRARSRGHAPGGGSRGWIRERGRGSARGGRIQGRGRRAARRTAPPSLPRRWWRRGTGGRRERPARGSGAEQSSSHDGARSSGSGGDSVVIPSPSRPPGVCIYSVSQGTVARPIRLLLPLRGRSWPAPSAHHGHHRRPSVVRRAAVAFSRLRMAPSDSCHRHAVLPPLLMPAHGDMILHLHLVDSIAVVINS